MKAGKVVLGLIQSRPSKDFAGNLRHGLRLTRRAAEKGAKIICLPELYRSLYFPQAKRARAAALAETIPGESTEAFSKLARELGVVVIVPVFERAKDRFYNSVAVLDADGTLLGSYRKIHVPHDPLFYEQSYFQPGDAGFKVFRTRYADFSVLICYDQWFPEAARACVLGGAQLLFYPTAIGTIRGYRAPEGDWREAWTTVQRGHAIANSVHVAAVNRVGAEGKLRFWGASFVADAFGNVLKRAGSSREEVLIASVDLAQNRSVSEGWGFLRNRRPDSYGALLAPGPAAVNAETPRSLGYRMPAEWEPHEAIWLSWPHDPETFGDGLPWVELAYCFLISAIHETERVELFVTGAPMRKRAEALLKKAEVDLARVRFHVFAYADVWFRDYGPTFVVRKQEPRLAMVRWIFNAWGGKYKELKGDTEIPGVIAAEHKSKTFSTGVVMEGGSIDVNGRGTVLTTEQCLLNKNRNPHLTRNAIEEVLRENLGVTQVLWLKEGIAGDDTDGHIDDIARFIGPSTVLCAVEDDAADANYKPLKECFAALARAKDQDGRALEVLRLPMPDPVVTQGRRLPASYTNFYIGNGVVLAPVFGCPQDDAALDILAKAFPGRRIAPIPARDLVYGLGTLHCISQQQPKA